jgi:hypothetical protein
MSAFQKIKLEACVESSFPAYQNAEMVRFAGYQLAGYQLAGYQLEDEVGSVETAQRKLQMQAEAHWRVQPVPTAGWEVGLTFDQAHLPKRLNRQIHRLDQSSYLLAFYLLTIYLVAGVLMLG